MKVTPALATALAFAFGAIVLTAPGAARAGNGPAAVPDIRGQWRLDHARSDDLQKKLQEMMENMPASPIGGMPPGGGMPGGDMPPGGGMPGGGMPGGGMPEGGMPGGMGDGDVGGPGREPPNMDRILKAPETFTLEQSADTIGFVVRGLLVRRVLVNGGKSVPASTNDGVDQASARWKKTRLVVESRGPRHEKILESWELFGDGKVLRCTTTLSLGPMGSLEINRIYTRVEEAGATNPAPEGGGTPR